MPNPALRKKNPLSKPVTFALTSTSHPRLTDLNVWRCRIKFNGILFHSLQTALWSTFWGYPKLSKWLLAVWRPFSLNTELRGKYSCPMALVGQPHLSLAMRKCVMSYANNKGADQPAHPRSLISAFIVRCLYSIISLDSIAEISRL